MNANEKNELVSLVEDVREETVDVGLVEVGSVSEQTKGSPLGHTYDNGGGYLF